MEERPASVPQAQQAGAAPANDGKAKPWVWTRRMLEALAKGVKGGKRLLCQTWALQPESRPCVGLPILSKVNHRPESRMREICKSGSEGGGPQPNAASLPLSCSLGRKPNVTYFNYFEGNLEEND
jgi:hypothetical protein